MNIPVSYKTLARYLDGMPNKEKLTEIFLTHICEVEGEEQRGDDTVFELKITPDRGHLLSYLGLAREVSVHSKTKLKVPASKIEARDVANKLSVEVADTKGCVRYVGRVVEGVDGRESPAWLREALEASGQRSINAIVDVTNFVMLELGQPMHAFDADKLSRDANGEIKISVRAAKSGEKMETLDGKDVVLPEGALVIADETRPLAIAGVKGGAHAGVGEKVNTIILEAATFNPVLVRKASAVVGIRTDSSRRFEHGRAPEIASLAMERATELLLEIFPGARAGEAVDVYPRPANQYRVGGAAHDLAEILGVKYSSDDLANDLERLGFLYERIANPAQEIVSRAKELVGTPYFYGASVLYDAPKKFDCSGFAMSLYLLAGMKIPRISVDQYVFGDPVELADIQAGDLVFSVNEGSEVYYESVEWMKGTKVLAQGIDHVGVYLGDGLIAHASRYNKSVGPDGGVLIEKLSESLRFQNITGVRRIRGVDEERFVVMVPPERLDIRIFTDLAEEIARLKGYSRIKGEILPDEGFKPAHNDIYGAMVRVRNALVESGFSEIFTYAFRKEGNVELANPMVDGVNYLRANLAGGMRDALVFNTRNAPLLGLDEVLMFEIGTVFLATGKEETRISIGASALGTIKQSKKEAREHERLDAALLAVERAIGKELSWVKDGSVYECVLGVGKAGEKYDALAPSNMAGEYRRISVYPFVLRDIAMWASEKTTQEEILAIIREEGGALLVRDRLFDVFEKDFDGVKKTSYAFNLVFQSYDRTLSDIEVNEVMERITKKLSARGFEVR